MRKKITCNNCRKSVPLGKYCSNCGQSLNIESPTVSFLSNMFDISLYFNTLKDFLFILRHPFKNLLVKYYSFNQAEAQSFLKGSMTYYMLFGFSSYIIIKGASLIVSLIETVLIPITIGVYSLVVVGINKLVQNKQIEKKNTNELLKAICIINGMSFMAYSIVAIIGGFNEDIAIGINYIFMILIFLQGIGIYSIYWDKLSGYRIMWYNFVGNMAAFIVNFIIGIILGLVFSIEISEGALSIF